MKHLIGAERGHWLNVERPRVTQHRVDLLFEVIRTLELILVELQSFNDPLLLVCLDMSVETAGTSARATW